MSDEKPKRYETEWSFSFETIGKKIDEAFASLSEEVRHETFSAPLAGVARARVQLVGAVGRLTVRALEPESDQLFHAETASVGELDFAVTEAEGETIITLRPKRTTQVLAPVRQAFGALGKRDEVYWTIRISPDVPVHLDLDGIVGPTEADLSALRLLRLDIDGNVGPSNVTLPAPAAPYSVNLNGVVGQTTVRAGQGKGVRLNSNGAVGQTTVHIPANTGMEIDIDGAVGQTTLHVPADAALHVEAEGGIGGVNLPDGLAKVRGGSDFITRSGVWESPGFALTEAQITVRYDGGVGSLRVHQEKVEIV